MTQCEHDEHAHKHALIIVDDGDGRPCVTGAKCVCSVNDVWQCDSVSYGDDFTSLAEHKTSDKQYLCHSTSGKVSLNEPKYIISNLSASNSVADYVISGANVPPIHRIDRQGNISVLKSPNHKHEYNGWISTAAAIDDSVLLTSKYDITSIDLCLTDIASDRIIRSETNMNRNNILWSITAYGPNTWVSSIYLRACIGVYDDRVPEWLTTQYSPKIYKRGNEFALSSCVDTMLLFSDFDFQVFVPTVVSALDLRNWDRFDLAAACGSVNVSHMML